MAIAEVLLLRVPHYPGENLKSSDSVWPTFLGTENTKSHAAVEVFKNISSAILSGFA